MHSEYLHPESTSLRGKSSDRAQQYPRFVALVVSGMGQSL